MTKEETNYSDSRTSKERAEEPSFVTTSSEETKIIKEFKKEFAPEGIYDTKKMVFEIEDWLQKKFSQQRKEIIEGIEELHNKSESRSAELECGQGGYEYGLEDSIKSIKNE